MGGDGGVVRVDLRRRAVSGDGTTERRRSSAFKPWRDSSAPGSAATPSSPAIVGGSVSGVRCVIEFEVLICSSSGDGGLDEL
jgi:hypothetical protein